MIARSEQQDREIEIRPLGPADLSDVQRIEDASYSMPWSRNTFLGLVSRPDTDMVGAIVDGRVVGFAVSWFVVDQAELGNIAVDEAYRRMGIGSRLIEHVIERSRQRGASAIYLEVRRSNTAAQKLYRGHSFRQVGVRRRYYVRPVEDALVMMNALPAVERVT